MDAFVTCLEGWKAAFPDASGEVTRLLADRETTVLGIVWRGTHTGPLDAPAGVVPASGRWPG